MRKRDGEHGNLYIFIYLNPYKSILDKNLLMNEILQWHSFKHKILNQFPFIYSKFLRIHPEIQSLN